MGPLAGHGELARRDLSFLAFDREQPDALVGVVNAAASCDRDARRDGGHNFDGAYEGRGRRRSGPAVIAHLFKTLNLKKITANYQPTNERSGALLRRLGFMVEGSPRDHLCLRGAWRDHVLTSLTNPNWKPPVR